MEQHTKDFCKFEFGLIGVIITILMLAFCSCKSVEYVPVIETRTEHHWHTDSVRQRDSTHTERETVIRELDSAAMARYGIQMQANQRAWLVLQREIENRLRELEHMTAQRDTVRDSIPVPYPVTQYVEKKLSTWQVVLMTIGTLTLMGIMVFVAIKLRRFLPCR